MQWFLYGKLCNWEHKKRYLAIKLTIRFQFSHFQPITQLQSIFSGTELKNNLLLSVTTFSRWFGTVHVYGQVSDTCFHSVLYHNQAHSTNVLDKHTADVFVDSILNQSLEQSILELVLILRCFAKLQYSFVLTEPNYVGTWLSFYLT